MRGRPVATKIPHQPGISPPRVVVAGCGQIPAAGVEQETEDERASDVEDARLPGACLLRQGFGGGLRTVFMHEEQQEQQAGDVDGDPPAPVAREGEEHERARDGERGGDEQDAQLAAACARKLRETDGDGQRGQRAGDAVEQAVAVGVRGAQHVVAGVVAIVREIEDRAAAEAVSLALPGRAERAADGRGLCGAARVGGRGDGGEQRHEQSGQAEPRGFAHRRLRSRRARGGEEDRREEVRQVEDQALVREDAHCRHEGQAEGQWQRTYPASAQGQAEQGNGGEQQHLLAHRRRRVEHDEAERRGREEEGDQREAPAYAASQQRGACVEDSVEQQLQRERDGDRRQVQPARGAEDELAEQPAAHEAALVVDEPFAEDPALRRARADDGVGGRDQRHEEDVGGGEPRGGLPGRDRDLDGWHVPVPLPPPKLYLLLGEAYCVDGTGAPQGQARRGVGPRQTGWGQVDMGGVPLGWPYVDAPRVKRAREMGGGKRDEL